MTRKEKVYNALKNLCLELTLEKLQEGFTGFDATIIGQKINVARNNASKELNDLVDEKRVVKIKGRPVGYLEKSVLEHLLNTCLKKEQFEIESLDVLLNDKSKKNVSRIEASTQDVFNSIIGCKGSLQYAIKQAKAAILYPPNGLHTLLVGPTGVGKTTFAEIMYKYALQNKIIKPEAQFVVFNCSEYADNPQLLLSHLFGYVKGAFTGAEKDKAGLIEKADGGILLLDEIHRLPPEGQEMLYLLIDKGLYRKLGESENVREAKVLLIGATTEDITSSLLSSFLRRIPMLIKLPSLSERPVYERYHLIKRFFMYEAQCVQGTIKVYKDVINALLLYNCPGNIGQLRGDIQLLCARGYLDYNLAKSEQMEINKSLLPEHVYNGFFNLKTKREELEQLTSDTEKNYCLFSGKIRDTLIIENSYDISDNLYNKINTDYSRYVEKGYSGDHINEIINSHIEAYYKKLLMKCNAQNKLPENEELYKFISPRIYFAVEMALKLAEQKLQKKLSKKVYIAIAMHISALIERRDRLDKGRPVNYSKINDVALNHPAEYKTARLIKRVVEEELEILMPEEEVGLISMFLYSNDFEEKQDSKRIGLIVLAHGEKTASSIAGVVNTLTGTNHCKAIDMPLNENVQDILDKAVNLVENINMGKGVLLLVDMGSLLAFAEIITQKTKIPVKSMEMVSTPLALEAVRKCLLPETELDDLVGDLRTITPYIGGSITNSLKKETTLSGPKTIITTCLTGTGAAVKLADLLKRALPSIDEHKIQIIHANMNTLSKGINCAKENILAVIGSIDLKIPNVPYIPVENVLAGDGIKQIEKIIGGTGGKLEEQSVTEQDCFINMITESLTFLDPIKAFAVVNEALQNTCKILKRECNKSVRFSYILHTCYMVERIIKNQVMTYHEIDKFIAGKQALYQGVKEGLVLVEDTFSIEVPDTEIGYVMEIFDTL